MASSSDPQGLVQPLSVGNVVSVGLRLYSDHFKQYMGVALVATLWILLPIVTIALIVGFFASVQDYYALLGLIIPAWLVLLAYCVGKYMADSAAIARLAFGELTQQPESTQQAKKFTSSRLWWFWVTSLLTSLIFGGVLTAFYLLVAVLFAVAFGAVGGLSVLQSAAPEAVFERIASSPGFLLTFGLGMLVVVVLFIAIFGWFSARFSIADVPLAIELDMDGARSVGRSWQLTKKSAWRIFLILFIAAMIAFVLQLLIQIVTSIISGVLVAIQPSGVSALYLLSITVSYIFAFMTSALFLPFWQTIKAALYYDLRSRREGLGLRLRG
ncbi:MAG: glycerophosphoryl diester phosphodiesterase membrane domain-containing protein [Drouetiella hepatica Uher 2000/2452]|jgi:membrane-anchored glycerophosphoryl diester phosphodiesterase (GDPDase)|uniref:Glycerophosphoryl diester phosphodiesterase membrane domain-containing protein n=1 Tax=Drouetiella hepatica Uher 2000/2452 TaxID=904376 RepID=A0A951UQG5_9CYAN|nr:glycerophosphoryl diester phosphodiesterase membrane domain-containing protein [Drouetiella hepatica Uher 2000/2452]